MSRIWSGMLVLAAFVASVVIAGATLLGAALNNWYGASADNANAATASAS